MLADWLVKICTDHPLVSYLEDPFSCGDTIGYQRLLEVIKEKQMNVSVGVKTWFASDIE